MSNSIDIDMTKEAGQPVMLSRLELVRLAAVCRQMAEICPDNAREWLDTRQKLLEAWGTRVQRPVDAPTYWREEP